MFERVLDFADDGARDSLRGWIRCFGGEECASLASGLRLDDGRAMIRVLEHLVDCVLRRILPLRAEYAAAPDAHAFARALPSVTDAAGRAEVIAAVHQRLPRASLALRSTAMVLHHLDHLVQAQSPDEAAMAWKSIFYPSGCLELAVARTIRAGASRSDVAAALRETLEELTR